MSDMYGKYAPYLGDLINCRIEPDSKWEPMTIYGLTSGGEFVFCYSEKIYYVPFVLVKRIYAEILANGRNDGRRSDEVMTDEEVVESFITGNFFERGNGRLWYYAYTYFDRKENSIGVFVYGSSEYRDYDCWIIKARKVKRVKYSQ